MLLGVLLAILSIRSMFKNIFFDYKLIGKGMKDKIVVVLVSISLIGGLIIFSNGFEIDALTNQLNNMKNLSDTHIQYLKNLISKDMKIVLVSTSLGYLMYFLHVFTFNRIQKEIDKEIEKNLVTK